MELVCAVQKYAWGVKGKSSSVAQLAQFNDSSFKICEETPYAEFWMGTHPNGPSTLKRGSALLSTYIAENPACLGEKVLGTFGKQLPFLFKVLSVNQALSIQAHPDKAHAEELYATRPDVYKDPNHKPEMTIALTPFLALCGFRPKNEITFYFRALPELRQVVGSDAVEGFLQDPSKNTLKTCFEGLMKADKIVVDEALSSLKTKFQNMDSKEAAVFHSSVYTTLLEEYPGDGGCFALYLLNVVNLQPGEAMFLGPNIIHAYLKGDCVECMACSDNVVRAGLTPKYQDVDTLVAMLEYDMTDAQSRKFQSSQIDNCCQLFNPPVPDFAVEIIKISAGSSYTLRQTASCSIFLVVSGKAELSDLSDINLSGPLTVFRGSVLFMPALCTYSICSADDLTAFRALCE